MVALREVVAFFETRVDDRPLRALDSRIDRMKSKLGTLASAFSLPEINTAALVAAGAAAVKVASDAEETMNVIETVFQSHSAEVVAWSHTVGDAMSRSNTSMRSSVAQFGAFLETQFGAGTEQLTEMSQRLTELSVDLASFYNVSDEEAQQRLLSGLQGETEAVRRLGVDISDAALDTFNRQNVGQDPRTIGKRTQALTLEQKTYLRYLKILAQTQKAHGDAIKTAGSFANQLKALKGEIEETADRWGKALMPTAKEFVTVGRNVVEVVDTVLNRTQSLQAYFLTAGLALTRVLIPGLAALALKFGPLMVMFAALEDAMSALKGGNSLIGTWMKANGSKNPQAELQLALAKTTQALKNLAAILIAIVEKTYDAASKVPLVGSLIDGRFEAREDALSARRGGLARMAALGGKLTPAMLEEADRIAKEQAALDKEKAETVNKPFWSRVRDYGYRTPEEALSAELQSREAAFSAAVASGDVKAASDNALPSETPVAAFQRYMDARTQFLAQDPSKVTQQDLQLGTALPLTGAIETAKKLAAGDRSVATQTFQVEMGGMTQTINVALPADISKTMTIAEIEDVIKQAAYKAAQLQAQALDQATKAMRGRSGSVVPVSQ